MKYLLIYFYFSQVCAVPNSSAGGPPYYYIQYFDNYVEANKARIEFNASGEGQSAVLYGYPQFGDPYTKDTP